MSDFTKHKRHFERLASVLEFASSSLEPRVTIQQLLVLARVIEAESTGKSVSMADIRERDNLGRAVSNSYQLFLSPSRLFPEGLGWLELEEDPNDRRRKTLKLTPAGRKIAEEFARRLS